MRKKCVLLIHFLIALSIIHAPFQRFPTKSLSAYAADGANYRSPISKKSSLTKQYIHCLNKDPTDPLTNLYHPECLFQNEVSLVDQLNSEWYDSLFTFLVSLSFLNMQSYLRQPRDLLDCPDNVSSKLSWNMARIGSLMYVISEYSNNDAYRSIASEVSKTQSNDLDSLISVYKKQKNVATSKLGFSALLKKAYLASQISEIANINKCHNKCKSGQTKAWSKFQDAKKKLGQSHQEFKEYYQSSIAPFLKASVKTSQNACLKLEKSIAKLDTFYAKTQKTLNALAIKEYAKDVESEQNKRDKIARTWMNFVPGNAVTNLISSENEFNEQALKDYQMARSNNALSSKLRVSANSLMAKVEYASRECLKTLENEVQMEKIRSQMIKTARYITKQHQTIQEAFNTPVLCCGSEGKVAASPPGR